jgi:hypothetical protein
MRRGWLDRATFIRQNAALTELLVDRAVGKSATRGETLVDASSRFVANGARWQPSSSRQREILRAAFGELECESLWCDCPIDDALVRRRRRTCGGDEEERARERNADGR